MIVMSTTDQESLAVCLRITLTFGEYLYFSLRILARQARFVILIAAALIVVYLVSPWTGLAAEEEGIGETYGHNLGALLLPGVIFILLPVSTYFNARKRWNSASELREPK